MKNRVITKSITIDASPERIWQVLTNDQLTREWYAEFMPGVYAKTNWQPGSEVLFSDANGDGIAGTVTENKPGETLIITFEGILKGGAVDYEGEEAQNIKGTEEAYRLTKTINGYQLSVKMDSAEEHFQMMDDAWSKAIRKIKDLSELTQ